MFKYEIGQDLVIEASGESGRCIARAEYETAENKYYIRYQCGDGRAVEVWWSEDAVCLK